MKILANFINSNLVLFYQVENEKKYICVYIKQVIKLVKHDSNSSASLKHQIHHRCRTFRDSSAYYQTADIFMHLCKIRNLQNARDAQNYSLSRLRNIKRISIQRGWTERNTKPTRNQEIKIQSDYRPCGGETRREKRISNRRHPIVSQFRSGQLPSHRFLPMIYERHSSLRSSKISKKFEKMRTPGKV